MQIYFRLLLAMPEHIIFAIKRSISCFEDCTTFSTIRRNIGGATIFSKSWQQFNNGFGNTSDHYWMGNEQLCLVKNLSCTCSLQVEIQHLDNDGSGAASVRVTHFLTYESFSVAGETDGYTLHQGRPVDGNATSGLVSQTGQRFSTWDVDDDADALVGCARVFGAEWSYGKGKTRRLTQRLVRNDESKRQFHVLQLVGNQSERTLRKVD